MTVSTDRRPAPAALGRGAPGSVGADVGIHRGREGDCSVDHYRDARESRENEAAQIERANVSTATPVVFVHGLWLLPTSWEPWAEHFEEDGFVALTPGWPDDPETVEEAKANPDAFAGKSIGEVADHFETVIRQLDRRPAIVGHSFGGLLTEILAGRGLGVRLRRDQPAPFRGVLPLPISALRAAARPC